MTLELRQESDREEGVRPLEDHKHATGGLVRRLTAGEIRVRVEMKSDIFLRVTNPSDADVVPGAVDVAHELVQAFVALL